MTTTPVVSALSTVRADLVELLQPAVSMSVFSEFPEVVAAPFVAVGPGSPYIEFEGATFGHRRVRLAATIVADVGTNDMRVAELDAYIVALVEQVDASDNFMVYQVDQPGQIVINGQPHLGASVLVLTEIPF